VNSASKLNSIPVHRIKDLPEHRAAFKKRDDYVSPDHWTLKINNRFCAYKVNPRKDKNTTFRDTAANKRVNDVFEKVNT